ncbi:MAG: hypothetical protein CVT48_05360 [Thermoplasmata archaeon HGW-Thermoplasmata-1]|nr:MAG: hypothetical protein CVT48_05360 [Thermoplasmata archaeon HGW-Thermoplasmata-1]
MERRNSGDRDNQRGGFRGGFSSGPRGGSGGSFGGPREMHKAKCAECGQECEVPFKPDGDRPVYCRDCYAKHRPPRRDSRF